MTLTYPGEWTRDGRAIAGHLRHFRVSWERHYGPAVGVWKREYQRRGAPHYHLALAAPAGVPLVEVQRWVITTWYGIVGSGDLRHLARGTGVEPMRKPPVSYFSCHGQHGRDQKEYQNEVPEDVREPGRFWGFWNLSPDWDSVELGPTEFAEVRRLMRAWAKSKGYKVRRNGGRVQGCWFRTRGKPAYLLRQDLLRAVSIAVT